MIPGGVNPMLLSAGGGGYQAPRSLRLRVAASPSVRRTFPSAGDQRTWSLGFFCKRGSLGGAGQVLLRIGNAGGSLLYFGSDDKLHLSLTLGSGETRVTSAVYRDPSAWLYILLVLDTTQAVSSNRVKIYVNGEQVTSFSTAGDPLLNAQFAINSAGEHVFFQSYDTVGYFDGYATHMHFVNAQALTPSAFGEIGVSGNWQPKEYGGTYGTNGFRLKFDNPSSLTTLTADSSGNGNNWTATNVSLTAGATYDSMLDVPLGSGGGERGNYAVLPAPAANGTTISEAGLRAVLSASTSAEAVGSIAMTSGKWYWEVYYQSATTASLMAGVCNSDLTQGRRAYTLAGTIYYYGTNGNKYIDGGVFSYSSSFGSGNTIGFALDMDAGTLRCYRDGVDMGILTTGLVGRSLVPAVNNGTTGGGQEAQFNFGQRPFTYTPPVGFKALHTGNLPEPSILDPKQHHNVYTVTKSGNTNFTLDWDATVYDTLFIIKRTDVTGSWYLVDGLRGYDKVLYCPSTSAENTDVNVIGVSGATCTLKSTLPDGVYVIEAHKAGLSTARSTDTSGTITATVSANLVSGFSMVTYTGTAANATVGHGQGTAPQYGIVRNRGSSIDNWNVYHAALTSPAYRLRLNTTDPEDSVASMWNSTAPTSSVFSVGTQTGSNGSASPMLAYWWSARAGYSAFTSYTGNASTDGPYSYLGFKARGVETKGITVTSDWLRLDAKRSPNNPVSARLIRNTSDAESSGTHLQDFTANGDKIRNSNAAGNNSGSRYLINAFAEAPFKNALAR